MQPLSPLDGRYAQQTEALRPYFTEDALIRARLVVEIRYLEFLSEEKGIPEFKLTVKDRKALEKILQKFNAKEADEVRRIEKKTRHDVKAVEYYLKRELERRLGPKFKTEFVHFALTSEDVNNLAYGMLIQEALQRTLRPELQSVISALKSIASKHMRRPMLSLTHGQPATPTTLGKEMMVFIDRLIRQYDALRKFSMHGKFGGAVGTYSAHRAAYPDLAWEKIGRRFIKSLKLQPLQFTTQINPHDDMAELSHIYCRINTILLSLSRDIWSYISRGVFKQKVVTGEVGSSTMPHKVNPIDFENAEGNLGVSSALFTHFAEKLPVSRLQRDLSDSTVQRSVGVAFGYHLLSLRSLRRGLEKLSVDASLLSDELDAHPEVLTEAVQTVMRKCGIRDAYEQMKSLSRGKPVTRNELREFITKLQIKPGEKKRLLGMM